ncbi:MAG: EexN family lipoprotein [Woeseiaceae bacterium]|nr:EexN family lipoprotein [Woeseiaceae bacterium]
MKALRFTCCLGAMALLGACTKEPPPRSVQEFLDNPLLLEAALVRCTQNRAESRYNAECVNAREAVKIVEAKEERKRQAELEAQSQAKREALRRTQQAAAEARRRAEEARRRREEAEYLAQFGELPPGAEVVDIETGNEPLAVIPEAASEDASVSTGGDDVALPTAGSNAPTAEAAPEEPQATDLESIRDELRRRSEDGS